MADNVLYYGDNLDVLRRHIKEESVDLIYLDPPFNSDQNYNVLFAEHNGTQSSAQIRAFEDTWRWDQVAAAAYDEIVTSTNYPQKVSQVMQSFRNFLGDTDMTAYLCMMAQRLVELHRVLRPTGSIYLHCDPTASHYLKLLMDAIFGPTNFRNEIVWKRTSGRKGGNQFGRVHDIVFFYTKSEKAVWNAPTIPQDAHSVRGHDLIREGDKVFRLSDFSGAGQGPERKFGRRVIAPPPGRHWMFDQNGIDLLMAEGRIAFSRGGMPRLKKEIAELSGVHVTDVMTDIDPINAAAAERLGYPTQKPEALLERIINASSNEGDLILDPFCGCGTAVVAAHRLKRRWTGIDITHLAITLIKSRLRDIFGDSIRNEYQVIGEPASLPDAETLASEDPYQFQWWALGLAGARPVEQKRGADKGIDGRLYFHDEAVGGKTKQIIFSVKAGHVTRAHVYELRGVVEREAAEIGVLISLEEPTQPMRAEAASAGFYESRSWNQKYPRLQLLTVGELMQGKRVAYPASRAPASRSVDVTYRKAPKVLRRGRTGRISDLAGPEYVARSQPHSETVQE